MQFIDQFVETMFSIPIIINFEKKKNSIFSSFFFYFFFLGVFFLTTMIAMLYNTDSFLTKLHQLLRSFVCIRASFCYVLFEADCAKQYCSNNNKGPSKGIYRYLIVIRENENHVLFVAFCLSLLIENIKKFPTIDISIRCLTHYCLTATIVTV